MKTAIYPGSFDPITLGHLNIIRRASGIFERVVVCIMPNAGKLHPMFTREERVALARRVVSRFPNVEVDTFDGLLAEYAKTFPEGAVIVKGLRANTDFENEFQMALINKKINPGTETLFFTTSADRTHRRFAVSDRLPHPHGTYRCCPFVFIMRTFLRTAYTGNRIRRRGACRSGGHGQSA